MTYAVRYALLLGAAIAIGTGVAIAQRQPPAGTKDGGQPTYQSYQGKGRLAERFLGEFDINKDGKVTHDEFNRTLAHEFSVATGGKPAMSLEQYADIHLKDIRDRAAEAFHRMDWNGDGKVSLDEYMASERSRFELMDRDSSGVIPCGSSRRSGLSSDNGDRSSESRSSGTRSSGSGSRGRASVCFADDLNGDGKVTRAEFDKVAAQEFNGFAKNGSLTLDQYDQLSAAQSKAISARVFQRLDRDRDGKLTLEEFASSQERLFARLDKNNDGVVTQDELSSSRRGRVASRD